MRSFKEAVVEVLRKRGPMPVDSLVEAAPKLKPATAGAMPLDKIVAQYRYESVAKSPEACMYLSLEQEGRPFVTRIGRLRVGLRADVAGKQVPAPRVQTLKGGSKSAREPIGRGIDEKSLETLLVERLDLLDPGLTLIKRQFSVEVGVLDLLCLDRRRNLVVVEIKRPRSDSRTVVEQISSYMGWVRRHMAGPGQLVRGIIVVGREDERLRYSLDLLENTAVRPFF